MLRGQMWDEMTFIAEKNGARGILFEIDFCSKESEASFFKKTQPKEMRDWYRQLPTRAIVVDRVLSRLAGLANQFPSVDFCVPEPDREASRPLAWAFVPSGVLDESARDDLGYQLVHLLR